MTIDILLKDKSRKIKERTETISGWLLDGSMPVDELVAFAEKSKDSEKATCIEALEYATKQDSNVADENVLNFVTKTLTDKAPRVKWESARVIANIAHLFPTKLNKSIANLLINTEHEGTVVRWAAAFALSEIVKLKTKSNKDLIPKIETILKHTTDNAIKKIYEKALKQVAK